MVDLPNYEEFMYPLLEEMSDEKPILTRYMYKKMADKFELTEEQRKLKMPNGKQTYLHNRVSWAKSYLYKGGLINKVKRGMYEISEHGIKVLKSPKVDELTKSDIYKMKEWIDGRNNVIQKSKKMDSEVYNEKTPYELIQESQSLLNENLKLELLTKIKESSPQFFEELIIKLVVAMGYGGNLKDAGEAIGKAGDDGVDGIIKEDVLGLEKIYLQAKRWNSYQVGSSDIRDFLGSLDLYNGSKGIFITTSDFSVDALDTAERSSKQVILINGDELTDYMLEYNVGVQKEEEIIIKKLDIDFFEEE